MKYIVVLYFLEKRKLLQMRSMMYYIFVLNAPFETHRDIQWANNFNSNITVIHAHNSIYYATIYIQCINFKISFFLVQRLLLSYFYSMYYIITYILEVF